jgi:hypothetical protein
MYYYKSFTSSCMLFTESDGDDVNINNNSKAHERGVFWGLRLHSCVVSLTILFSTTRVYSCERGDGCDCRVMKVKVRGRGIF